MDFAKLDPAQRIAIYGRAVVAVLGNVEKRDYELVDLELCPVSPEAQEDFHRRELAYVCTMGIREGRFVSAFELPLDAATVTALANAFVEFAIRKLTAPQKDTGAEWLQALYNLKDDRERRQEN
jgi:hypothetical protein